MSEAKSQLLAVLTEIVSQDQSRIKQAEALLKQWESSPNFFATLQDLFCDRSIDEAVRVLCGIYLKNGIDRFWRRSAKNPISPEEKQVIRERLLQFIDEPSKKLTVQNAAIIAKIARLDYPQQWPELLPSLIQSLQTVDLSQAEYARLVHYRILEIINEVLTELASRRLVMGRRQFAEIVPTMFQTIVQVYAAYVDQSMSKLSSATAAGIVQDEKALYVELEIVTICSKSLKTLLVSGVKDIQSYEEPKHFIEMSLQHLQQYMTYYSGTSGSGQVKQAFENVVEEIGALYLAIQKSSPFSCVLCPAWIPLLQYYWTHLSQEGAKRANPQYQQQQQQQQSAALEPFLLQGMLLIHATIESMAVNQEDQEESTFHLSNQEKSFSSAAQQRLQEHFLTEAFVSTFAECLVRQYMLLTANDMDRWEDDPEGWFIETTTEAAVADHWEFDLRPCAEKTFTTVLHQYRPLVLPLLLNLVDQTLVVVAAAAASAPVDQASMVLLKDAVYAAIGLGVKTLYGHFDFERFVMTHIVNELKNTVSSNAAVASISKVLKRRVAWTLGKWVSESISEDCRKVIFELLLRLMAVEKVEEKGSEQEDFVVRLTAAHALTQAVDNWEFDISLFLPYLGTTMATLLNLLSQAEESETVLTMINDLKAIIIRTGTEIFPYASDIVRILIPYWNPSSEPLLLSSLIDTFRHIIATVKEESVQLHSVLIPIVKYCIDPANEAHVYLLEDALELWWTLLQTTPINNNDLMSLYYPPALELLDYDTENLRKILKIIESYILLEPSSALGKQYQPILFEKLAYKMKDATPGPVAAYLVHTLDLIFQSAPLQLYGEALVQSNVLTILLQLLMEREKSQTIAKYMNLVARLSVYDPHFVINIIQATTAGQSAQQANEGFVRVLEKWLDNFDYLDGHNKKVACIGFTQLLLTGHALVLNKLPNIMAVWMDAGFDSSNESNIVSEEEMDLNEVEDCQETLRKKQTTDNDPLQQCNLLELIRSAMNQPFVLERLPQIDPYIVNQVNSLF